MSSEISVVVDPFGWPVPKPRGAQLNINPLRLVASSAATQIWRHCEPRSFRVIVVYPRKDCPHCDFNRDSKDRVRIGLFTSLSLYSQQAFQFAHEFCHAIAGHSREGQRHDAGHANHWLEECLCEAASLFSLRRMAEEWPNHKEFSKWTAGDRPYAPSLHSYAQNRIDKALSKLSLNQDFRTWFESKEQFMRDHPIALEKDKKTWDALRDDYTVIATRLLPLLEAKPENWEAISYLNMTPHRDGKSLSDHLADWKIVCAERFRPFVEELERLFLPQPPN